MRRNLLALASQVQQAAGVQQVSHGRLTSAPLEWPCDQQTRSLAMPCNADRGAHDAPQGLQELLAFTAAAAATRCQAAAAATTPLLCLGLRHSSSSLAAMAARQQQLQGALLPLAAAAAARQQWRGLEMGLGTLGNLACHAAVQQQLLEQAGLPELLLEQLPAVAATAAAPWQRCCGCRRG